MPALLFIVYILICIENSSSLVGLLLFRLYRHALSAKGSSSISAIAASYLQALADPCFEGSDIAASEYTVFLAGSRQKMTYFTVSHM